MNNIPPALCAELELDPYYKRCARFEALHDHECRADPVRGRNGRIIEWEHALVYANKQVQRRFAIVPLCWYVHRGPSANKEINVWIALNRATAAELRSMSKAVDYIRRREYLNAKYGAYREPALRPKHRPLTEIRFDS